MCLCVTNHSDAGLSAVNHNSASVAMVILCLSVDKKQYEFKVRTGAALQLATGLKYAKHADSLADMRLSSVLGELYIFRDAFSCL